VNRSLVNRWLARFISSFQSRPFARRDGSLIVNLHEMIIQINAYQSIQLSLITKLRHWVTTEEKIKSGRIKTSRIRDIASLREVMRCI